MKKAILLPFLWCILLLITGCAKTPTAVNDSGILRGSNSQEQSEMAIAQSQTAVSAEALLSSLPPKCEDTVMCANGSNYKFSAAVEGGQPLDITSFSLKEKTVDTEWLKSILFGDRASAAVELEALGYEGQTYWAITDKKTGNERETLSCFQYGNISRDEFNYQRENLIYDDDSQSLKVDESIPSVSDESAVIIAAPIIQRLGAKGLTVLEGYNYTYEVTFYFLPQFTALPIAPDAEDNTIMRVKATVCNGEVYELSGASLFLEIAESKNVENLLPFPTIMDIAKTHLAQIATKDTPSLTEISLRHRYLYDETLGTVDASLVWYFSIPSSNVEDDFGIGQHTWSFMIDAVTGLVY